MRALIYFLFAVACTAWMVWMEWADLHHCTPSGICTIEAGRIMAVFMLIGGACFVAYQFSRAFEE